MLAPLSSRVRLGISDLSYLLNVPLQPNVYDGTSGLGGSAELKGLPKPATFGYVYNIAPVYLGTMNLGDGSLHTYQGHWREVQSFDSVRDQGLPLTDSGAVAPAAGEFRQWKTDGVVQLGAAPAGVITCDLRGDAVGSYANNTGEVLTRMLTSLGPALSSSLLETQTFTDIDLMMSGEIGIYFGPREVSMISALEQVLAHAGLLLAGGRNGKLRVSFADPVFAPEIKLTQPDIVALQPVPLPAQLQPAPVHVDIVCERNWAPLTLSQLAGSVTASSRRKLTSPGRRTRSTSSSLDTRQKPDRVLTLPGLFRNDSDAQIRGDQVRDFIEQGLVAYRVTTDRYPNVVEIGHGVWIESYGRYGLEGGFAGIVADWDEIPHACRTSMILIGALPGGYELREDGTLELREDGTIELRE
jgi:hypothetical protein